MMPDHRSGTYVSSSVAGEECRAFIPPPLPPVPPLSLTAEDYDLMEKANRVLGRLDGVATLLPDKSLFLYFFVRKEAVLSSQIEGTPSSICCCMKTPSHQARRWKTSRRSQAMWPRCALGCSD